MSKIKWVYRWGPNGKVIHQVKTLGVYVRPDLPRIVEENGGYSVLMTHAANRQGVLDTSFPTLREAKDYVEIAIYAGVESGLGWA